MPHSNRRKADWLIKFDPREKADCNILDAISSIVATETSELFSVAGGLEPDVPSDRVESMTVQTVASKQFRNNFAVFLLALLS